MTTDGDSFRSTTDGDDAFIDGDSPLDFADPLLPLVMDIGCGFGVSLLGLARTGMYINKTLCIESINRSDEDDDNDDNDGSKYNFLGCDLSKHAINYARGIASRWGISDKCKFCVISAEPFVTWVLKHYQGPVKMILIQYPTPYSLPTPHHDDGDSDGDDDRSSRGGQCNSFMRAHYSRGNSQLPHISISTATPENMKKMMMYHQGFMVTDKLIETTILIAAKTVGCIIMLQSNVQDVAVTMHDRFTGLMSRVKKRHQHDNDYNNDTDDWLYDFKSITNQDILCENKQSITSKQRCSKVVVASKAVESNDERSYHQSTHDITDTLSQGLILEYKRHVPLAADSDDSVLPLRSVKWVQMGGKLAIGEEWLTKDHSILSPYAKTETEAMYESFQKTRYCAAWIVIPSSTVIAHHSRRK